MGDWILMQKVHPKKKPNRTKIIVVVTILASKMVINLGPPPGKVDTKSTGDL